MAISRGLNIIINRSIHEATVGDWKFHASPVIPAGWLLMNGAALSRTTYAALFGVIGTTWGQGDGATTFNLPDMRGEFARGVDMLRGADEWAQRAVGSWQASGTASHAHAAAQEWHHHAVRTRRYHTPSYGDPNTWTNYNTTSLEPQPLGIQGENGWIYSTSGVHFYPMEAISPAVYIGYTGGAESRPRNRAFLPIIKY